MSFLDPLTWAILLLLIGCAMVVLEVFIPSGGLLTFFSGVAILAAVVTAFRRDATTGLSFVVIALVAVPSMVALAFKVWPVTPMGKAFLGELPSEEDLQTDDPRRELIGRVGIATSKMLPAGAVQIDGQLLDAISHGTAIDEGEQVVVIEVKANRVVVRRTDPDEAQQADSAASDILSQSIDELGLESMDDPLA